MDFNRNFNSLQQMSFSSSPLFQIYAVSSKDEAQRMQIQYGVKYLIINKIDKEIYMKELNTDGNIDFIVYKDERTINVDENKNYEENFNVLNKKFETLSNDFKNMNNNFNNIYSYLKNSSNFINNNMGTNNEYVKPNSNVISAKQVIQQPNNGCFQPNDGWKNFGTTETNPSQFGEI